MTSTFFIPAVNIMGNGCLDEAMTAIRNYGFRNALIVTDAGLAKAGVAAMIAEKLAAQDINAVVFDGAKPNPSIANVEAGLVVLKQHQCDFVLSLGGGSPHDCAKGIALCATNGGHIRDYEGVDRSAKPQLPLVAINTTAGTASEMTRFCIITDEERHVKMAIVDRNVTPLLSVNDPQLMVAMPKGLTAATGMDALTHAVEAYVSTAANPITDACAIKAMQLISEYEPHSRGAYGGCIGFIGLNGTLNQAITIRTFVSRNNELWFQAGGGIVAKSNEEYELQEVNNKLGALKKAIILAEQM